MCQLSRESEPVCPLGVREDMHGLLSNTEIPKDPMRPLDRVMTEQYLSQWESQDQDLTRGRKKAPPEDGRTAAHTAIHMQSQPT